MPKERKKSTVKSERLGEESKEPVKRPRRVNLKVKVKRSTSPDLSAQWREGSQQHSLPEKGLAKQAAKSKKRKAVWLTTSRGENKVTKKKRKRIFRQAKEKKIKPKIKKENLTGLRQDKVSDVRVERDKRFMMWTGVTFFMILIAFFWLYNTKQVFERSGREGGDNFSLTDWQELTDEISEKMNQMKQDWENIEAFSEIGTGSPARLPASESIEQERLLFSTSTEMEISQEELNNLKEKLEELEQKPKDE